MKSSGKRTMIPPRLPATTSQRLLQERRSIWNAAVWNSYLKETSTSVLLTVSGLFTTSFRLREAGIIELMRYQYPTCHVEGHRLGQTPS